jgi:hypothetical protein
MFALTGLAQRAEPFGALLLADGSVNQEAVAQLFDSFDADGNGFIDAGTAHCQNDSIPAWRCWEKSITPVGNLCYS